MAPLNLTGPVVIGLAVGQAAVGLSKHSWNLFPIFVCLAPIQIGAAAVLTLNTVTNALDGLSASSGAANALPDLSAYLYLACALLAVLATALDILITSTYVLRGIPFDDLTGAIKIIILFSLPGFLVLVAAVIYLGMTDLDKIAVSPLSSSSNLTASTALNMGASGLAAATLTALLAITIINMCSSVGNRRFAATWFLTLFLCHLPCSVLWGVAALAGAEGSVERGGAIYMALCNIFPLMSLAIIVTKECYVLEKFKSRAGGMAFVEDEF